MAKLRFCRHTDTELTSFGGAVPIYPAFVSGRLACFSAASITLAQQKKCGANLSANRPDIVHVQNLFPLLSPSVIVEARRAGVPVVMTVQNYRLLCPNGLHLRNGKVCEKCCRGHEFFCALHNCERSLPKSIGYA